MSNVKPITDAAAPPTIEQLQGQVFELKSQLEETRGILQEIATQRSMAMDANAALGAKLKQLQRERQRIANATPPPTTPAA
jgi:chromosome segregation ATPase